MQITKGAVTFTTKTVIRRWGNSKGIRLTKEVLSQMDLKEDDAIEISIYNGRMVIEKIQETKCPNLKERLESFYKRPIEEIYVESTRKVDVGGPEGSEFW